MLTGFIWDLFTQGGYVMGMGRGEGPLSQEGFTVRVLEAAAGGSYRERGQKEMCNQYKYNKLKPND